MSMSKRQFDKCLREFPWLWGIEKSWGHNQNTLEISVATFAIFDEVLSPGPSWIHGFVEDRGVSYLQKVPRQLPQDQLVCLGTRVIRALGSEVLHTANDWHAREFLQHVALLSERESKTHVKILRPPKGEVFHWFLKSKY